MIVKKHYYMFKGLCGDSMIKAYENFMALKKKRDDGSGAYNYSDDKSNMCWDLIKDHPLPENIIVNKRMLDRALMFCKQLIKSHGINDFVKDEFRPNDTMKH